MDREPDGTLITLLDEDGNQQEYEHLGSLNYNDTRYVALTPHFDDAGEAVESDGQLVILKVETDDSGDDILVSVEEDEYYSVASEFEKLLEEEYDFEDDDGTLQ